MTTSSGSTPFGGYVLGHLSERNLRFPDLAEGISYHVKGSAFHPTPEGVRQWTLPITHPSYHRPRLELVDEVAKFFGDPVNDVRALVGYAPSSEPEITLDEIVASYRENMLHTPSHLRAMAHRVAIAATSAITNSALRC